MFKIAHRSRFAIRHLTFASLALLLLASSSVLRADDDSQPPDLSACPKLQVPDGNAVKFRVYAVGVQIYVWTNSAWVFVAPSAHLYADPGHHGLVGTHFAGPTWQTRSGSKVVGHRLAACTPDSSAIPWLLLSAASSEGPGVLDGVTFIQRVNTLGGIAPSSPGSTTGETAEVPYTAEYYFYGSDD
jgi:hypothetical protein